METHAHLLLATPPSGIPQIAPEAEPIAQGHPHEVLQQNQALLHSGLPEDSTLSLSEGLTHLSKSITQKGRERATLIAISSLLVFIQNNFVGPQAPITASSILFPQADPQEVHKQAVKALSSFGQVIYEHCEDPLLLLLSLHILEEVTGVKHSLLNVSGEFSSQDSASEATEQGVQDALDAVAKWWRVRALSTLCSLYPEFSGPHIAVMTALFDVPVLNAITLQIKDEKVKKDISILFHLEKAKVLLESNLEHLVLPELKRCQELSQFEFVLTGARAKRTKFQQTAHAQLIVLGQSNYFNNTPSENSTQPEAHELNSDLLLERPHYEAIGTDDIEDQVHKRQKWDETDINYGELLPTCLRQEYIPEHLQKLDPNNQPTLSDFDNIQLLLRLYTLRSISPSGQQLIEAQLMSVVQRVLYQSDQAAVNYTIFSRGLWERSVLETNKARTIERGILQMQTLVEEIGLKISEKYIPAAPTNGSNETTKDYTKLRYIFQLPLIPRWQLDTKLAEKFMALGIVKSAIEIYARLQLTVDVALCHASIGEESQAKKIIEERIAEHPEDARAWSVLGDITQDTQFWLKAWEVGKYWKAKVSLGKFFYKRNIEQAIGHLHDALKINPLNYDTWFLYGCFGLESQQWELSAEAFTRCVAIDDTSSNSWSNLATALLRLGKTREAFSSYKRATSTSEGKNWRLWENYLLTAAKLGEWDDVLWACRKLIDFKKDEAGEGSIDIPVVEKLVEILTTSDYDEENLTFFQKNCLEFTTVTLPGVITTSSRLWRIIARVELWRKKPWNALDCHEKAYRALAHNPDLDTNESIWNETVEACADLVAAYESLGELPGKHGAGDVVCKDWKYKAKQTVKSLMSKGKMSWEDNEGWEKLQELKEELM